jgi:hypothetical protein
MKHHPLEVGYWIAGIAVALLAAISLWSSNKSPPPTEHQTSQVANAEVNRDRQTAATKDDAKPARNVADPSLWLRAARRDSDGAAWHCEGVAKDLKPALAAANALSSQVEGDRALAAVARNALCIHDFTVFDQAAAAVRSQSVSDKVYFDAVRIEVEQRKFDLAHRYAAKIRSSAERDRAMKLIVNGASVEGRN